MAEYVETACEHRDCPLDACTWAIGEPQSPILWRTPSHNLSSAMDEATRQGLQDALAELDAWIITEVRDPLPDYVAEALHRLWLLAGEPLNQDVSASTATPRPDEAP